MYAISSVKIALSDVVTVIAPKLCYPPESLIVVEESLDPVTVIAPITLLSPAMVIVIYECSDPVIVNAPI